LFIGEYVEKVENGLIGCEIKIERSKFRIPKVWQDESGGNFLLINWANYHDFMLEGMKN
jgi:hypothetical protein